MATFDKFITSLRQQFGEQAAGKKFEVFCKWFLENDPEWSKTVDKVWLWDEYPNKWQRQDLGTDIVFRDNEGLIWAVQAKCYSEHRSTTKGDMNSFLADTGQAVYLHELTDSFVAERVIRAWIKFYNTDRPHTALDKRTPDEAYFDSKEMMKAA